MQAFLKNHERLAARIRGGKRVSRKVFKRHVERIPAVVLMDKKASCGTEPSTRACDAIDQLIADALMCWACRE